MIASLNQQRTHRLLAYVAPTFKVREEYEMSLGTLISGGVLSIASLLLATVPEPPAFDSTQILFAVCLAGGIGGGLMAILLFPLTRLKQTAFKWLGSSVAAAIFGPAACQYYEVQSDIALSLAVSGTIGLVSWTVLLALVPLASGIAKAALKRFLPWAFPPDDVIQRKPDWIDDRKP